MTVILDSFTSNPVTAVILAGGQSRRMGTDKAQLLWQGQPLLQRVYQVASACTSPVYVLTPWPERYRGFLPNAEFILESPSGGGPLVALAQIWPLIPSEWLWLLACDLPCLDSVTLKTWLQQLASLPAHVLAQIPQQANGQWEPLCGFYRQPALSTLIQFLAQGGRSYQAWLQQLPTQPIPVTANVAEMLINCNTPSQLS